MACSAVPLLAVGAASLPAATTSTASTLTALSAGALLGALAALLALRHATTLMAVATTGITLLLTVCLTLGGASLPEASAVVAVSMMAVLSAAPKVMRPFRGTGRDLRHGGGGVRGRGRRTAPGQAWPTTAGRDEPPGLPRRRSVPGDPGHHGPALRGGPGGLPGSRPHSSGGTAHDGACRRADGDGRIGRPRDHADPSAA